jgi:hypothetical protein
MCVMMGKALAVASRLLGLLILKNSLHWQEK